MAELDLSTAVSGGTVRKKRGIESALVLLTIVLGLVHTWAGRYSMSPDGISYLDVGSAFFRRDWFGAFNAYWSPLYAWIQGIVLGLLKPSETWEFPIAHAVNFLIFLVSFLTFRFVLRACLQFRRWGSPAAAVDREFLPDWAVILLAYPMFWWACFELMPLYEVGPDLALSACLYAAMAIMLRARMMSRRRDFVLLGVVLGAGYWVKAPFFLLSFAFLAIAYLWGRRSQGWVSGITIALVTFLLTASALFIALSIEKHRPTFGDSARLNYAWFIAPQTFHRNWQGEEAGSGTPAHPTHEVLRDPPVYTFDGPVRGSYPPWQDPSYWNEGLQAHFALKPQLRALATDLMTEGALLLRTQPALLTAVVFLMFLSGAAGLTEINEFWPLPAIALCAFAMYAPVHVEPRFLGGFVLLLFLTPIVGARVRGSDLRAIRYLAIAVFGVMAIGALDTAIRFTILHPAVPGNGPSPTVNELKVAHRIRQIGLAPGDPVAVIGDGTGAYWARLAKVRIVAEIMGADHDAHRFWRSSGTVQCNVLQAFAAAGARLVVADNPTESPGSEWIRIEGTNTYLHALMPYGSSLETATNCRQ